MFEFTARIEEASAKLFAVKTPAGMGPALEEIARKCAAGYISLRLAPPRRPRTTGPRSQNSGFHGWCEDISVQTGIDAGRVKEALKRIAVKDGYPPTYNPVDDAVEPKPTHEATIEEMNIVMKVTQRFADEHSLWLTEYIDGVPTRCIGGVPIQEI